MTHSAIVDSLKNDDNKALHYIYVTHGDHCIKKIIGKRNCSREEAEDLFIEAVMVLRENVLKGTLKQLTNTPSYLYQVIDNKYLAKLKREKSKARKLTDVEHFYYSDTSAEDDGEWNLALSQATKHAWGQLSEKCRDIIYHFYVDSLRMKEIATLLGFANADVAKSTKARCYKQFTTWAREYYQSIKKDYAE